MERIPVAGPWITEKEIAYVTDAVTNAWYRKANIYHERFEKAFADYIGVSHATALPSCTSALHLSLLSLGVGPGDEVIVPDITWIATSAPIMYVGATPVFADIDPNTWCLSVSAFEQVITDKTKAVIVVDLYGGMPDWDSIRALATDRGIAVIEDAAQAIGSEYRGKKAGSFGDTGVFSFHGSKTLTTGEGGMLVTDREDLYKRCLFLRDHGRVPGEKMFWNSEVACKYKMSSMQAALGLAQLERIDELIKRKRDIFSWYKEELSDLTGLCINREPAGTKNSYWMVTAVPTKAGMEKELVIKLMGEHKIDCRPFFYPLSSLPAYKDLIQAHEAEKRNAVSYRISPYGFNLPSNLKIERQQVSRICDSLRRIMGASESSRYGSKQ